MKTCDVSEHLHIGLGEVEGGTTLVKEVPIGARKGKDQNGRYVQFISISNILRVLRTQVMPRDQVSAPLSDP